MQKSSLSLVDGYICDLKSNRQNTRPVFENVALRSIVIEIFLSAVRDCVEMLTLDAVFNF
jgi:hypothetical protein